MTRKGAPKKPSRPLGHIVLPKKGSPRAVIEALPSKKEELETTIVSKFAHSLAHFERRHIQDIRKADPWPDFEGQEGIDQIGIEVVELVNPRHNVLRRKQEDYEAAILETLGNKAEIFSGLKITLDDNYQEPPYPKVSSIEGRKIVESFVQNLLDCADEIANHDVGRLFSRKWQNEAGKPQVGIFGRRLAPRQANLPTQIGFAGTFPELVEKVHSLLAETIQHKIGKSYTRYDKGLLLLLVYEAGSIWVKPGNLEAIGRAQSVLEQKEHHFDEVWYILLLAESDLGVLHKVWPKHTPTPEQGSQGKVTAPSSKILFVPP